MSLHKHRVIGRVLAGFLAIYMCISVCVVNVSADSQSNQRAMIRYFENQGANAISEKITDADLRLFGLFVSNFYTPYETVIDTSGNAEDSSFPQVVKDVCAFLLGYSDTESMSAENAAIADKFAASMVTTVMDNKKQLYMRKTGENEVVGVTWTEWFKNTDSAELVDADGNTWFTYQKRASFNGKLQPTYDDKNAYCDMATLISLSAGNDAASAYMSADNNDSAVYALYIDSFGDIIDGQGTVLIPACINPYTYSSTGNCLPINNAFYMGGLLSSLYTIDHTASTEYTTINYDYTELLGNLTNVSRVSTLSPYVCGLLTTFGKPNIKMECNVNCPTDYTENAQTTFVLTAISDTNDNFGNFLTTWLGVGQGVYDAKVRRLANTVYVTDIDVVLQDVYTLNKTTAGTFDFSNAVKHTLFSATAPEEAIASAETSTDLSKASVLWNPAYRNCLTSAHDLIIGDIKGAVHKYAYYFDYAIEDIGRQLTSGANTSGKLQKADRLNMWAEIFYAYMMYYDELNPNLPSVIVTDALNTALASITGDSLTDDALNKQNAELANKLLKRMMVYTNEGRNEEKGTLVLGFVDSFLLGLHRTMLGLKSTDIANVSNADNRMFGFVSPVSIPTLDEVPITSQLLEHYRTIYAVLFIIAFIAVLLLLLLRLRTATEVIATVLLTAFCLLIPQTLLDSVIQLTNTAVDKMYSNRFTYWALIQHQQDLREESEAIAEGVEDYDTSLTKAMSDVSAYYDASDGIQLRWMAAKKGNNFAEVTGNIVDSETTIPGLSTFKWLFSGYLKQESYADDPMATYVYRTYASIAEAAKTSYDNIKGLSAQVRTPKNAVGFTPQMGNSEYTSTRQSFYKTVPLASGAVTEAINNSVSATSLTGGLTIGTTPDAYEEAWIYLSESPFYYFYNVLKNACGEDSAFLNNFLSDYVYKTTTDGQAKGALKDFLDLEGLCTNVIPYMASANSVVNTWVERYGITSDNYRGSGISDEQVNKMWNLYCPWVDSLYDLECVSDTVTVWDETMIVNDAFNPSYYYDAKTEMGRQMIFSESERINAGINSNDLTTVERKLLQVTEQTYEDLRYLANYAQFDSEAIITAAAMAATFNFNRIFSETTVTGDGITLYPQGYELKTFNLDAYLRLILLNNTGTSVFSTTDIYETVLDDGGCIAGIGLIVYDVIALWVLPTAKLLMVLLTFFASLLFAGYLILQKPKKILALAWKDLILPPVIFGLVTTAYAGVVAMLMGDGLDMYVGSRTGSFVTNSIGVTLFTLIIVSLVLVYAYWKLVKTQVKDVIAYGCIVKDSIKAVASEIGQAATDTFTSVRRSGALTEATRASMGKVNSWDEKHKATKENRRQGADSAEDVYNTRDNKQDMSEDTLVQRDSDRIARANANASSAAEQQHLAECAEKAAYSLDGTSTNNEYGNRGAARTDKANTTMQVETRIPDVDVDIGTDNETRMLAEEDATKDVEQMEKHGRSVNNVNNEMQNVETNNTEKLVTSIATNNELASVTHDKVTDSVVAQNASATVDVEQAEQDAQEAVENFGLNTKENESKQRRRKQ